jgi:hypothetical protein
MSGYTWYDIRLHHHFFIRLISQHCRYRDHNTLVLPMRAFTGIQRKRQRSPQTSIRD